MTKAGWTQCLTSASIQIYLEWYDKGSLDPVFDQDFHTDLPWMIWQRLAGPSVWPGLPYRLTLNDVKKARWTQCLTRTSIQTYLEWYDKGPLHPVFDQDFHTDLPWMIWQRLAGPSVWPGLPYRLTLNDMTKARWTQCLTRASNILGTSSRDSCRGPSLDWILCSGWQGKKGFKAILCWFGEHKLWLIL